MSGPSGILLVDKPQGWTSFDVVAKSRNTLKAATGHKIKVGHTGTLDPIATGLLVLMVGEATKRAENYSKLDKTYLAEATLGANSTTDDAMGELTMITVDEPKNLKLMENLDKFKGNIHQRPPKYSALKVNGQRAYKLAREGRQFNLKLRPVTIYALNDVFFEWPKLRFTARVSSGTYIRALARDIGKSLGTGGYLSRLRRTKVGKFSVEDATLVTSLDKDNILKSVIPLEK